MNLRKITLASILMSVVGSAFADSNIEAQLSLGTLGAGIQFGYTIAPNRYGVRFGVDGFNYNFHTTSGNVNYDGHLKLQTLNLLGDWHPFESSFRLTAGLFRNLNKFELDGQPSASTFTFNNQTYPATPGDSVNAKVDFRSMAPYLGIGWGSGGSDAGLHFTSDFGVISQGSPQAHLTASVAAGAADPQFQSNVQAAQAQLQSDLDKYRWYPLIRLGAAYRF